MPFALPPEVPSIVVARDNRAEDWYDDAFANREWFVCDSTRQTFRSFRVGDVTYRSSKMLRASFAPPFPGGVPGRYVVDDLQSLVVGYGNTLDAARRDWELGIDMLIQNTLATHDFELSAAEKDHREIINRFFDLAQIRYASLLRVRSVGKLMAVHPRPWRIRWIDGTSNELMREQLPVEMVRLRPGQMFEAVVERDPRDWTLVRVISVFPCLDFASDSETTADEILSSVPTTAELPDLDWD